MYLYKLSPQQVTQNAKLQQDYSNDRFKYNWYGDTRNPNMLMIEFKHDRDNTKVALKMPDRELYTYIDESTFFETHNLYLYKHLKNEDQFYDPVNNTPIYRITISDSNICFQRDYFYHRVGGNYYTYKDGKFSRHDLISNFQPGDLLYGTEPERLKVRNVIKHRLQNSAPYVTADEIHRMGDFNQTPFFSAFDAQYDTYIDTYQAILGKSNPQRYHPYFAQAKTTKGGVTVSKGGAQLRRSCKVLIRFIMLAHNKRIHFIVDNIQDNNLFTDVERRHVKKYRLYENANFKAYSDGKQVEWPWKGI
jgi:hypothetical protein